MQGDLRQSPTALDAEIRIPIGIQIETERHQQRWVCSVRGCTLSAPGGIVVGKDPVFVVIQSEDPRLKERAEAIVHWLKSQKHGKNLAHPEVVIENRIR